MGQIPPATTFPGFMDNNCVKYQPHRSYPWKGNHGNGQEKKYTMCKLWPWPWQYDGYDPVSRSWYDCVIYYQTILTVWDLKIKVCLWNTMPTVATKSKKLFLCSRSKSRSQRHWPLMSFERISLVEYAYQIWSLYHLWFKSYSEG